MSSEQVHRASTVLYILAILSYLLPLFFCLIKFSLSQLKSLLIPTLLSWFTAI